MLGPGGNPEIQTNKQTKTDKAPFLPIGAQVAFEGPSQKRQREREMLFVLCLVLFVTTSRVRSVYTLLFIVSREWWASDLLSAENKEEMGQNTWDIFRHWGPTEQDQNYPNRWSEWEQWGPKPVKCRVGARPCLKQGLQPTQTQGITQRRGLEGKQSLPKRWEHQG